MNVAVRPSGNDRFVGIHLPAWGCEWSLQFPEAIACREGAIMAWPHNCAPRWETLGEGWWGYTWRPTEGCVQDVRAMNLTDSRGNPQYAGFFLGVTLRAELRAGAAEVRLSLTLANESERPAHGVWSEGGCLQAAGEQFRGGDEVARSQVMVGGSMVSMAALHRTVPDRCQYFCDSAEAIDGAQWYWGRSSATIDRPAIVGAASRQGSRCIALGYQGATSGWANSDDHHCLHSAPWFGDLAPGASVTRRGLILFGEDTREVGGELARRLRSST